MPLEQLLARYGYTNNPDAAGPSHPASSPPHPTPQAPGLSHPSPSQKPDDTPSRANDSSQQTKQTGSFQSDSGDKGKGGTSTHRAPPGGPLSASTGAAGGGTGEGVVQVRPEEQAEQAAAAGMDAFEHSQALAERRASGSQAGPSAPPAPGTGLYNGTVPPSIMVLIHNQVVRTVPMIPLMGQCCYLFRVSLGAVTQSCRGPTSWAQSQQWCHLRSHRKSVASLKKQFPSLLLEHCYTFVYCGCIHAGHRRQRPLSGWHSHVLTSWQHPTCVAHIAQRSTLIQPV